MSRLWALVHRQERKDKVITRELKERLADYFGSYELVEYLAIPVEDIIEVFEDAIDERLDDILEIMGISNGESTILDWESEEPSDT